MFLGRTPNPAFEKKAGPVIRNRTSASAADIPAQKKRRKPKPVPQRSSLWRKRWLIVVIPITVFMGLIALAPRTPEKREISTEPKPIDLANSVAGPFAYQPDDEVYALEVVAMVLAEMTELGAFVGEGAALSARHQHPVLFRGTVAQEGTAEGHVWLHEPRVVVTNPVAE